MALARYNRFGIGTDGMVSDTGSLLLKETDAELLKNVDLSIIGKIKKRKGTKLFGSYIFPDKPILGMYEFTTSAGVSYPLATCTDSNGNDTYRLITSTLNGAITTSTTEITLDDASSFSVAGGTIEIDGDLINYQGVSGSKLIGCSNITFSHDDEAVIRQWIKVLENDTVDKKTRFTTLVDYVFRVNGADVMKSSTNGTTWGTTYCLTTSTTSLITTFVDRVITAGDATYPDRIYASSIPSVTNVLTWDRTTQIIDSVGSNGFYIDINPEDSSNITALERNGSNLLIFKDRAMYTWNGSATQADELISIGAVSQEVVKTVHNITFFLGRSKKELGVYAYTGGYPKNVGRKIKRWTDAIDQTTSSTWCAGVTTDKYMLYVGDITFTDDEIYGTRTFSDVWLVYSIPSDSWTVWTGLPARMFGSYTISSAEKTFYGNNDGKIFEVEEGQTDDSGDSQVAIEKEFIGKEETYGSAAFPKTLEQMIVYSTNAQDSNVVYRYNRSDDWMSVGTLQDRVTILDTPERGAHITKGETIQISITNNTKYTSDIEGYVLSIDEEGKEVRGEKKWPK